ncbi:serine protease [Chamaesiphon sp. VAR_48_metabat_135_sub]|uniref:S1 family peptidase n=1 Tax=Chamaesiphon sp. VAR_48_metabat_135_sub TaxID=2964699 RepID=UPI00286BDD9A|nr:serine protease [Chamaesiphon sp. VAR_48_metabat_135_sub]
MSKLTPSERVEFSLWQYWIARLVPMLYVTTLTISLPKILTQSWFVSELAATQEQKLQKQLRSISIRVLAHGETIGSGVLLHRKHQVYTIITNTHTIQSASAPFQLQTHDGQVYAAALITPPTGHNRDLSILRFQSRKRIYATAKLAAANPKIGDRVWSSGFSLDPPSDSSKPAWAPNIVSGQITQILPIAVSGGYSIGSDYPIVKGMNGGPLVNRSGELVGINGIRANSLWDTPALLEDGSIVSDVLQQQLNRANWAIPIEFIKDYAKL